MARTPQKGDRPTGRKRGRPKKGTNPIKPEDFDEVVRMRNTGYSFADIGEKYNVTCHAVKRLYFDRILPAQNGHFRATAAQSVYVGLEMLKEEALRQYRSNAPAETKEQIIETLGKDNEKQVRKMVDRKFTPGRLAWLEFARTCHMDQAKLSGLLEDRLRIETDLSLRMAGYSEEDVAEQVVAEIQEHLNLIAYREGVA